MKVLDEGVKKNAEICLAKCGPRFCVSPPNSIAYQQQHPCLLLRFLLKRQEVKARRKLADVGGELMFASIKVALAERGNHAPNRVGDAKAGNAGCAQPEAGLQNPAGWIWSERN